MLVNQEILVRYLAMARDCPVLQSVRKGGLSAPSVHRLVILMDFVCVCVFVSGPPFWNRQSVFDPWDSVVTVFNCPWNVNNVVISVSLSTVNGGTGGAPADLPTFALDPLFRDPLIAISFTSHVFQNDFNVTLKSLKIEVRDYDVTHVWHAFLVVYVFISVVCKIC